MVAINQLRILFVTLVCCPQHVDRFIEADDGYSVHNSINHKVYKVSQI